MDRRSFVKGMVGASVAGAAVAAGLGMAKPLAIVKGGNARTIEYVSSKKVGGPAPRGVGIIPLDVNEGGEVVGLTEFAGTNNLDWYKYCGHNAAPGLQPSYKGDNLLRYFITPDKIAQGFNPWYKDLVGNVMKVEDYDTPARGVGFGAAFNWRSANAAGADIITGIIVYVGKDTSNMANLGVPLTFEKVPAKYQDALKAQVEKTGLLAFSSYCTHFCCVPGWKEAEQLSRSKNAWDKMFCTCHFSIYDPFVITMQKFLLEEEAEAEAGGAAH